MQSSARPAVMYAQTHTRTRAHTHQQQPLYKVRVTGYHDQPLEVRQKLSITNGLVRYACGIEDSADLIADVAQALEYVKPGMKFPSDVPMPNAPRGDGDDDPMQWMQKLVSDLPDLRAPITVNVDTTCSQAVTTMKNYCIDQLPVVQQFPGGNPDDLQVIAVISMAALSREMIKHPEIVDSPLFPYASPKFVVVQPTATLGDVAEALSAYTDRRSGDTGCAIVAEKTQGRWLLKHVISRVDILAFETEAVHASMITRNRSL